MKNADVLGNAKGMAVGTTPYAHLCNEVGELARAWGSDLACILEVSNSWSMLCKKEQCLVGMMKWVRLMVVCMVWDRDKLKVW